VRVINKNFDGIFFQLIITPCERRGFSAKFFEVTPKCTNLFEELYKTDVAYFAIRYELDKEFTEVTLDGREATALVTVHGNEMTIVQRANNKGELNTKIVQKFVGNEVVETDFIEGMDLVAMQRYKRI
jgi:hypothetical protein